MHTCSGTFFVAIRVSMLFFHFISKEFHSKDSLCLYDKNGPITPFSALKSEYTREFGKIHSPRSRSVPNKFDLNATTTELLDALRDDSKEFASIRSKR